ncbi:MAG TPA: ATPase, T2SS/T4P/T4SS family [Gammaproteobacteria bacterium]|nr:ATPase, T2SS/T4P/T4SS family [Gammaproteobacteria bacterium]
MFDIIIKEEDIDEAIAHVRCKGARCTIGKGRNNLVRLKGWRIGDIHAELFEDEKGLYIEDKGTRMGTRVNKSRIQHYGPLRSSDTIQIDVYRLFVGIVEEEPEEGSQTRNEDEGSESDPAVEAASSTEEPALPNETQDDATSVGVPAPAPTSAPSEAPSDAEPRLKSVLSWDEDDPEEAARAERQLWRNRIHLQLLRMMDVRRTEVESMDEEALREQARRLIVEIIDDIGDRLPEVIDRVQLTNDVLNEAVGLGPLEELIADDSITEIMVNRPDQIYVERNGRLEETKVEFSNDDAVVFAIERIVAPLGRRIDESSPMVDARLKDGSRVNAVIPPLALRGPSITIRKFSKNKLTAADLVRLDALSPEMVDFLEVAVKERKNIVISGGTGSGKTTFLNILSNFIPHRERIVTVEDAAELMLNQPHIVGLESRPPNLEGKGAITIRDLVRNCLRMRPDRIVVGECRGGEALDMLQAMNTGHDGSLTTVHANSPRDSISRLEVMVMMAGMELPSAAIREQVASAVDIIVQQSRFSDGSRRITHVCEVTGVEGNVIQMQDIFLYKQSGLDSEGKVFGAFEATGQIPEFYEDLRNRGIEVDMGIFS